MPIDGLWGCSRSRLPARKVWSAVLAAVIAGAVLAWLRRSWSV